MTFEVTEYTSPVVALGAMGLLMVIQVSVADFASMRARKVPGAPVEADHGSFLFRATRALANTNESVAIFLLLVLYGVLIGAAAQPLAVAAWVYVAGRVGHMLTYYANLGVARSLCFAVSMLALLALAVIGVLALLG